LGGSSSDETVYKSPVLQQVCYVKEPPQYAKPLNIGINLQPSSVMVIAVR
jgi:hypothetical protein